MLSIKFKKQKKHKLGPEILQSCDLCSLFPLAGTNEVLCIVRNQNSKAKIQKDKITAMVEVIEARQQII